MIDNVAVIGNFFGGGILVDKIQVVSHHRWRPLVPDKINKAINMCPNRFDENRFLRSVVLAKLFLDVNVR